MSVGAAAVIGCRVVYFSRLLGVVLFEPAQRGLVALDREVRDHHMQVRRIHAMALVSENSTRRRAVRGPRRRRPPLPPPVSMSSAESAPARSDQSNLT